MNLLYSGAVQALASVEDDKPYNRFNDAKCDRLGRLWCGTISMGPQSSPDFPQKQLQGCLYSFGERGE